MTFNIIVPNAAQSPGLFPAQCNTNFQRIKDIVNNDHNWTDSTSAAQGIHKQCTMINRTTPVGLPAGNGVLYSQADTFGASQLFWYNGATNAQITPGVQVRAGVTATLTFNSSVTLFPDPGYPYMAYVWCSINNQNNPGNYGAAVHNSDNTNFVNQSIPSGTGYGFFSFSTNDLILTNQSVVPTSYLYTIEIIRVA